jgi:hypothetical protein
MFVAANQRVAATQHGISYCGNVKNAMRPNRDDLYLNRLRDSLSVSRTTRRTRLKLFASLSVLAVVLAVAAVRQFGSHRDRQREVATSDIGQNRPAEARPSERTVFGAHPSPVDTLPTDRRATAAEDKSPASGERSRTLTQPLEPNRQNIPGDVHAFLDRWRTTLISGDSAAQAALYAPRVHRFFTKRNVTREQVQREKERMLTRYPEFHKYDINDVHVQSQDNDRVIVTFRKDWEARGRGRFAGSEQQRLTLIKRAGTWQIVSEEETKVHWVRRS